MEGNTSSVEKKPYTFDDLYKFIRQTIPNLPQDLHEFLVSFDKLVHKKRSKMEVLDWARDAFTQLYNFYHNYGKTDSTLSTHICLALARLNDVIDPYIKYEPNQYNSDLYDSEVFDGLIKIYKQLCKIAEDRFSRVTEFNYLEGYNPKDGATTKFYN